MGENTFKNIIVASILVVLFAFLLMSFLVSVGNENNVSTDYLTNDVIDFSGINQSLSEVQSNAENWRQSFERQNIFSIVAGVVVTGIFKIGIQMFSFIVNMFDLIFVQILNNVLGIPPIVTSIIIAVLIISAIFGLWRVLKMGD